MVMLVRDGLANATDVGQAFACARMTVHRACNRFEKDGLQGLVPGKRGRKHGSVLEGPVVRRMVVLKKRGESNTEIAVKLGVTEGGIRKALKRIGHRTTAPVQATLDGLATSEAGTSSAPVASLAQGRENEATQEAGPVGLQLVALSADHVSEPSQQEPVPDTQANTRMPATEAASASATDIRELVPVQAEQSCEAVIGAALGGTGQADAFTSGDPWDRTVDRLFARMGLLTGASPQFGECKSVSGLGVLLALPALMSTGVFDIAEKVYAGMGATFYGLRSVFLCLTFMALLRVKRAEQLRHRSPSTLGRVLGLDRAPEVKTLRRKVEGLAAQDKSEEFQLAIARRRVALRSDAMGFLYVDGHVRVYSGKVKLSKAHVTQMRMAMPATVDHWVNDRDGDPVLVITATPTVSLAKEMLEIASAVRGLLGDRRVTIVFDRGGWSPKLFADLLNMNFDVLTYRKGTIPKVRKKRFQPQEGVFDGRKVVYRLAERRVKLKYKGGSLSMREVVRLSEDEEHQTSIVTSRIDLQGVEVAYRMFERWRQENFFKYMNEEFAIDALWSYGTEAADPARDVPNPARKKRERAICEARGEVKRLEQELGAAAAHNEESKRPTMRGFKIANAAVGQKLRKAKEKLERLRERVRSIPRRVSAQTAAGDKPVVRLKTESKRLTDTLKSVAYQAETELFRLVRPHYSRHEDEGRKLIAAAMQLSGDIDVGPGELRITLEPAASPNRTRAIAALCDELNASAVVYPGTQLRLVYAIREA